MMFLKDPETGKRSVTLTMLVVGFMIASTKLFLPKDRLFTGSDFATMMGSLGALYWARRNMDMNKDKKP